MLPSLNYYKLIIIVFWYYSENTDNAGLLYIVKIRVPFKVICMIFSLSTLSISDKAFNGFWIVGTLHTLLNPLTDIGCTSFQHCYQLTFIILPNSITSIFPEAFSNCIKITSRYFLSSFANISKNVFFNPSTIDPGIDKEVIVG